MQTFEKHNLQYSNIAIKSSGQAVTGFFLYMPAYWSREWILFLWSRTFNLLTWKAEKQMHKYSEAFVESFPQCPQQPGLSQTGVRSHEAILVSHANGRHQEMDSSPGASRGALAGSRTPKWCKRSKQGTPGLNPDTKHRPQEWLSTSI